MSDERRIPGLDGVRALAVMGVIASHSGLFGLGWVGVDIFFGLSGYLITGILLDAKEGAKSVREYFVPFYVRRSLRILPLAWTFAILMAALSHEWSGLLWYVTYLVNWLPTSPQPDVLGHYWSLSVEEQFYLAWPAVVYGASRPWLIRISLGLLAFNILYRLSVSSIELDHFTHQFMDLSTPARADSLLMGALLAQTQRTSGWGHWPRFAPWIAALAGAIFVGVRLLETSGAPFALTYNIKWPVLAVGVGAGLMWVLHHPPRFLEWPWMRWLGKVSYGVYIIHAPFGRLLHEHFPLAPAPIIFALQVGITVPLAALSWYLFESPILRLKRFWPTPRPKPASAEFPPDAVEVQARSQRAGRNA